ncbi:MAG: virulence factor TspB C-terminal domain-related protein, partial [Thiohalocapsa sp.]
AALASTATTATAAVTAAEAATTAATAAEAAGQAAGTAATTAGTEAGTAETARQSTESTTGTGDGDGSGDGDGEGEGEGYCDPAVEECGEGETSLPGYFEVPTKQVERPVDWDSGLPENASCPGPITFNFPAFNTSFNIDLDFVCDVASAIRPLVIAVGAIAGLAAFASWAA